MLTTLLGWISILSSWNAIRESLKEYYALFLMLQTAMLGVFMSLDFLLFFIFREPVLVPMYFIFAIWGPRRTYAAIKFIIYTLITLIGSVLMLLGILTLYYQHTLRIRLAQLRYRPTSSRPTSHWASSGGSSGPFSWGLRSRCRCGRPTRGFLTPTSRRQLPVPSSWPAFC